MPKQLTVSKKNLLTKAEHDKSQLHLLRVATRKNEELSQKSSTEVPKVTAMMPNLRGLQKSVFALKTGPRAKEGHVEQKKGGVNLTFPLFPKEVENIRPIHFSRKCKDIFF